MLLSVAATGTALVLAACSHPTDTQLTRAQQANPAPAVYAVTAAHAVPGRPNIVFVLTDDLSDNLIAQMPAVLSMQRQGTSFSHYYVVDSLCCPSRAAIFTSQYPHDDGVYTNVGRSGGYRAFQAHNDQQRCFVRSLRRAGYTTGFMGKYLNRYRVHDPVPSGWDVWNGVNGQGYGEFNYSANVNGVPVHYGATPDDYLTDVLSDRAGAFIDYAAHQSRPFFLEVATFAPHAPYVPAPQYATAAQGALYPRTPAYDAQVTNPPPWLHQRPPLTPEEEQRMQGHYQSRVEADLSIDDLITNIRASLRAAGVARDTYIVFSSDNGYHMGEYRLLSGKQTAFDTDINVPLVIVGPNVPAGSTVSALASSIDLGTTFEALAHSRINPRTDGVPLLPIVRGRVPPGWQRAVLIEHHRPHHTAGDPDAQGPRQADPPSYEAVRTLNGLYVRYEGGAKEYYDTKVDPYELHNLGGKRAPHAMKVALRRLEKCHKAKACQAAATQPFKKGHRHKLSRTHQPMVG